MATQNNFNSKNRGDFADRKINNVPPKPASEPVLTSPQGDMLVSDAFVSVKGDLRTGNSNFSSKRVTK